MLEECTLEVCTLVDMHGGGVHVGGVQVNAGSLQFSHTLVLLHTYTNTLTCKYHRGVMFANESKLP